MVIKHHEIECQDTPLGPALSGHFYHLYTETSLIPSGFRFIFPNEEKLKEVIAAVLGTDEFGLGTTDGVNIMMSIITSEKLPMELTLQLIEEIYNNSPKINDNAPD